MENSDNIINVWDILEARIRDLRERILPFYNPLLAARGPFPPELDLSNMPESNEDRQHIVSKSIAHIIELACHSVESSSLSSARNEIGSGPGPGSGDLAFNNLPGTTSHYQPAPGSIYSSLPIDSNKRQIRMLQLLPGTGDGIKCRLEVEELSDSKRYDALSYVWGPPTPVDTIVVNDTPVQIRGNLHSALRSLRSDAHPLRLWVDAICIDQDHDREKGHQVNMVAEIYRNAQHVRIFLGDEEGEIEPFFKFLNREITDESLPLIGLEDEGDMADEIEKHRMQRSSYPCYLVPTLAEPSDLLCYQERTCWGRDDQIARYSTRRQGPLGAKL